MVVIGLTGAILTGFLLPRPLIFIAGWEKRTGAPIYIEEPIVAIGRAQWVICVLNVTCFLFGMLSLSLLWPNFDAEIAEKGKIEKMLMIAALLDDVGFKDVETFIKEKFTPIEKAVKK
jgi:hypothetical protein